MLAEIIPLSFADLYQRLTSVEKSDCLRRGVIPIYMAAIFHGHRQELLIQNRLWPGIAQQRHNSTN